jgi:UDPglucose 6-dehydrogenase
LRQRPRPFFPTARDRLIEIDVRSNWGAQLRRSGLSEVVIVGSGVVGTATGKGFAAHGHPVRFVDIDPSRVDQLRTEGYVASTTIELPYTPSFVFLTLPTPNVGHRYDLTAFTAGATAVGDALAESGAFHTVVVRSTVPPGTCDGLIEPLLSKRSGKQVDTGFALGSNPEFLRAATALEDFLFPWMTVVASRSRSTVERLRDLFRNFGGELRSFDDPVAAELVKCCHNLYNAAKISFWNEMWLVSQRLEVPADDVAATVARSAEGSVNPSYGIRGGAPYGGACLPKDTKGFLGFANAIGVGVPLMEAVVEVNERMERVAGGFDWLGERVLTLPETDPELLRRGMRSVSS